MYKKNVAEENPIVNDSSNIQSTLLGCGNLNNFNQNTPQRPQSYYQQNYEQVFN